MSGVRKADTAKMYAEYFTVRHLNCLLFWTSKNSILAEAIYKAKVRTT